MWRARQISPRIHTSAMPLEHTIQAGLVMIEQYHTGYVQELSLNLENSRRAPPLGVPYVAKRTGPVSSIS